MLINLLYKPYLQFNKWYFDYNCYLLLIIKVCEFIEWLPTLCGNGNTVCESYDLMLVNKVIVE